MLSLPVTFLEDWELFNGQASRGSGQESRQIREYRERTDSILAGIRTSFSGTSPSSDDSSTKRSSPITEDRSRPLSPSLASALTSHDKRDVVHSTDGRQTKRRKVKELLVDNESSSGGRSRLDNTTHRGEGSDRVGKSFWQKGLNLVGEVFSFVM